MNTECYNFEVVHVGLNTEDCEAALAVATTLQTLFGLAVANGASSVYAGPSLEIMKGVGRGQHGHIGIATADLQGAIAHLKRQGIRFDDTSAKYDENGRLLLLYLQDEIAGFAFHLLQA